MWSMSCFAESNRAPFDFAEGESELVSGFNVEYGGYGFALLFIAEYTRIIFMSALTAVLFIGGALANPTTLISTLVFIHLYVAIRRAWPRRRYDKLIYLCWCGILPGVLTYIVIMLAIY